MKILGIETSCDETAAAVVQDGKKLLSNVVASSVDLHAVYGGVVPEIAARSHIEAIMPVINQALREGFQRASLETAWDKIDAIAVTQGPGLGGSLLIGVLTARTLAIAKNKPLYGVNHVMAHPFANFLNATSLSGYSLPAQQPKFPMLALIVSGGHSQLVLFRDYFDYGLLGQTQDDAVGEAFDKVAKILGLPYPGGPSIEKKAKKGDPKAYKFPKAQLYRPPRSRFGNEVQSNSENSKRAVHKSTVSAGRNDNATIRAAIESRKYDFSFSGLKTAVLRTAQSQVGEDYNFPSHRLSERLNEGQKADIAASFQHITVETLVDKALLAYEEFKPRSVVIAGGVASSSELRRQISEKLPLEVEYTDPKLCTDNGAMIATLGYYMARHKRPAADPYSLDINSGLSM